MSSFRFLSASVLSVLTLACGSDDTPDDGDTSTSGTTSSTTSSNAASSATVGAGGGEPELADACARTSRYASGDGVEVTRCDELFAERPFVHVPAEKIEGDVHTLYGAYDPVQGIVLPNGESLALVDDADAPRFFSDRDAPWAARLAWPSSRVLVYVYEWKGVRTTVTIDGETREALRFVDARPVIYLPSDVVDGSMLGAWEGKIAGRLPVPRGIFVYGLEYGAAIRVEYTALVPDPIGLIAWDNQAQSFAEGAKANVVGEIVNMTTSVRGADGTCIAALSSNPDIPFAMATDGHLDLTRIAAMHAPGDMVLAHSYPTGSSWAAGGGMSFIGPAHPAAFIQDAERPAWSDYGAFPHGTPDGMQIDIHRVSGGGGACD